jgi:diaminopimelate epimerase
VIKFSKLEATGNDFVLIDHRNDVGLSLPEFEIDAKMAMRLADRHFGVGCDQVIWLKDAAGPLNNCKVEFINQDGSKAEMCGNGVRAVARYLFNQAKKDKSRIETAAGLKAVEVYGESFRVDMERPEFLPKKSEILVVKGQELEFFEISMGNPHAVFFINDLKDPKIEELSSWIETHVRFSNRTNVEWVRVVNREEIRVRVWERGAGFTLACGTGACASAVASILAGRVKLEWSGDPSASVFLTGPAHEVFRGSFLV